MTEESLGTRKRRAGGRGEEKGEEEGERKTRLMIFEMRRKARFSRMLSCARERALWVVFEVRNESVTRDKPRFFRGISDKFH